MECGLPRVIIGTRRADFGSGGEAIAQLISRHACDNARELGRVVLHERKHITLLLPT
jgi:hypothetical protein